MNKNVFLFSIDLEDVREDVPNGNAFKDRVIPNTISYLDWLNKNNFKCTFFVVGSIAEKYPDLIKEIINAGHEIACHSYAHKPLNLHTQDSFKRDVEENINVLLKKGASKIFGFRAPIFSLTKNTFWAHDILSSCGITYSSSVLPANNPLYGWKEFGERPKMVNNKILEIPMSISHFGPLHIPFAGGVYFRCLPFWFIKNSFKKNFASNNAVLSYFHPYDLDVEQEKFMHAGINDSKFYNFLMYYNRKNMIKRLDAILDLNVEIMPYVEYINKVSL